MSTCLNSRRTAASAECMAGSERCAVAPRRRLSARTEALAWAAVAVPLGLAVLVIDRPRGPIWATTFNALHVFVSALLGLVALRLSRRLLSAIVLSARQHYWVAAAVVLFVGGGFEAAQGWGPGDASWSDLARDVLGGVGALLFAFGIDSASRSDPGRTLPRRWSLQGLGVVLFGLAIVPSARAARRLYLRHQQFPVLASFETSRENRFVTTGSGAILSFVPPPAGFSRAQGRAVGKVAFRKGEYPRLMLKEPLGDWSSYGSFVFDVFSPETSPVALNLRINDRAHTGQFTDRFNVELVVVPGNNTFTVPLERVRNAPRNRRMDLTQIVEVVLFLYRPHRAVTLYFDNIRLERTAATAVLPALSAYRR